MSFSRFPRFESEDVFECIAAMILQRRHELAKTVITEVSLLVSLGLGLAKRVLSFFSYNSRHSLASLSGYANIQVPVVQKEDNAIHWVNHYPLDNAIDFLYTYPLDSDLSGG